MSPRVLVSAISQVIGTCCGVSAAARRASTRQIGGTQMEGIFAVVKLRPVVKFKVISNAEHRVSQKLLLLMPSARFTFVVSQSSSCAYNLGMPSAATMPRYFKPAANRSECMICLCFCRAVAVFVVDMGGLCPRKFHGRLDMTELRVAKRKTFFFLHVRTYDL